jgi:hypothetical protein
MTTANFRTPLDQIQLPNKCIWESLKKSEVILSVAPLGVIFDVVCWLVFLCTLHVHELTFSVSHQKARPGVEPATSRIWEHRQH